MLYDGEADYKGLLPELFQGVVEIDALANCVNIQINKLSARIKTAVKNKSVLEADEHGIERWEKILGVSAPLDGTLKSRREALLARLASKPPISVSALKEIIEKYMGVPVDISVKDYVIRVTYRGESKAADLAPLYSTLYEMIPANLILEIAYLYLTWTELEAQSLTFAALDAKGMNWSEFERGEWIVN